MSMDDEAWARHANPWSVYSRFTCLPLIVLAIWSRAWIGWWSLVPLAAALAWTWYNPRAFGRPESTCGWASRGTFGERVFLRRSEYAIPPHHLRMAWVLTGVSVLGAVVLVFGLVVLNPWATVCGVVLTVGGKLWFVDRMVWLFQDMQDADPEFRNWLK